MATLVVPSFAAVAACAGTYGFAVTLGSTSSVSVGAGSALVASCGSGMTFEYTSAFYAADSGYVVNGIDLSNIPADCQNKTLFATFYDGNGTTVGSAVSATLSASGTTQNIVVTPSSNTIDDSRVSGVSVVVS